MKIPGFPTKHAKHEVNYPAKTMRNGRTLLRTFTCQNLLFGQSSHEFCIVSLAQQNFLSATVLGFKRHQIVFMSPPSSDKRN